MGSNPTLATLNPFRYRGYLFDNSIGLYYLQSRYYDANTGRFINADITDTLTESLDDITDKNLFAYCDNNPVMRYDDGGEFWGKVFTVVAVVAAAVAVTAIVVATAGAAAPAMAVAGGMVLGGGGLSAGTEPVTASVKRTRG